MEIDVTSAQVDKIVTEITIRWIRDDVISHISKN